MPAVLFAAIFVTTCFENGSWAKQEIVGGRRVPKDTWLSRASVWISGLESCSGVVIAEQWVLTAAHCVAQPPSRTSVALAAFGIAPDDPAAPTSLVDRTEFHPEFDATDPFAFVSGFDLALLHLRENAPHDAIRVRLSTVEDNLDESLLRLTGYGTPRAGQSSVAPRLREVFLSQMTAAARTPILPARFRSAADSLIIADQSQSIGACTGDSGGGVYSAKESTEAAPYLLGIIAGGPANCAEYSVITRIAPHVAWIASVVASAP